MKESRKMNEALKELGVRPGRRPDLSSAAAVLMWCHSVRPRPCPAHHKQEDCSLLAPRAPRARNQWGHGTRRMLWHGGGEPLPSRRILPGTRMSMPLEHRQAHTRPQSAGNKGCIGLEQSTMTPEWR